MKRIEKQLLGILLACLWFGAQAASPQPSAMTYLEDTALKVGFDASGRIMHLENKTNGKGNIISSPADGIFGMVCKRGENWEDVVFPQKQSFRVTKEGNTVRISLDRIVTRDAASDVGVTLSVRLDAGTLRFDAAVDNRQPGLMVTDFVYPRIGVIKSLGIGKPDLLWPYQAGEWHTNIGEALSAMPATREAPYTKSVNYPGGAGMQWMSLVDGDQCLYFSGRDQDFYSTILLAEGSGTNRGAITLALDRLAFVKTGEKWEAPASIVQLYAGSWRKGAEDYRAWASTWRKEREKPEWVKNMMGYFLVINKQQYGDEMWPYDKLPLLYEKAKSHGFDALGLFGWYHSGHDNMYPDIHAAASLGGADGLRKNIAEVQKNGGKVTLYFQGHLMDMNSDFYKKTGHRLESKSIWGQPYYEKYNKSHSSPFLRSFTSKTFSTVCPASTEWHSLMTEKAAEIAGLGPNGILYDQIGGMVPNPCFDETHTHPKGKPSLSYTGGRLVLLDKIYRKTKEIDKEYAFFTEHITDVYSQFADCLHGINSQPGSEGARQKLNTETGSAVVNFPEMFRYCFPGTIITVRNPFPYITPRYVNYAATMGLRYELELRYLDDCNYIMEDRTPEWRKYAAAVTALRKKYWKVLGDGAFTDEEGLHNGNRNLTVKGFRKDDQLAVVLWNDSDTAQGVNLKVDGYALSEVSSPEAVLGKMPATLASQKIIIALYRKHNN